MEHTIRLDSKANHEASQLRFSTRWTFLAMNATLFAPDGKWLYALVLHLHR